MKGCKQNSDHSILVSGIRTDPCGSPTQEIRKKSPIHTRSSDAIIQHYFIKFSIFFKCQQIGTTVSPTYIFKPYFYSCLFYHMPIIADLNEIFRSRKIDYQLNLAVIRARTPGTIVCIRSVCRNQIAILSKSEVVTCIMIGFFLISIPEISNPPCT
jgi:hypothetical protein